MESSGEKKQPISKTSKFNKGQKLASNMLRETLLFSYGNDKVERGVTYTYTGIKESNLILVVLYKFTFFSGKLKFYAKNDFQLSY